MRAPPHVMKIERYSHGVRLSEYDPDLANKLFFFLERLKLKEPRKLPAYQGGGMVLELKKRFYGITENRKEIFIHRHHLDDLKAFLSENGYGNGYTVTEIPPPDYVPIGVTVRSHITPRPYQKPIIDNLTNTHYSNKLDLQTGKGKMQPLDAKIKVPGGWSTMGEMEVGETVTAWDGTPTKVTGVFPNGKKAIYRITFSDGRTTEAGAEHLWKVYYINTSPHKRWRVVDTLEMLRLISMPNPRVYVPLIEAEDGPDLVLPLEPYTLGVILGDGGISNTSICITKRDEELFDELGKVLPEGLCIKTKDELTRSISLSDGNKTHYYRDALNDMELMGTRSWEKHIPTEYLHGSRKQRLSLLQGLMDTDGTVNSNESGGAVSFNSTSYQLATGVQYLVRSLGGIASISVRNTQYTYNGEKRNGRVSYNVNIRHKTPSELFRLPRKKERTSDDNRYANDLKLRVASIEPVGRKETQCISIDHPDKLYVTDDFIVTHNTLTSLMSIGTLCQRTVINIPPKYFGIWVEALYDAYDGIEQRYITVAGSGELKKLMELALDEETFDYDFIIISNTTYKAYLDNYEKWGETISEMGYLVPPPRFHELVKAGVQINDEIQENPGLVFRTDIFTNVRKQIYLSATPYTGNDYVTRMIDVMLPAHTQCPLPELDVYINVIGLLYGDPTVKSQDYTTPFKGTYNHARYETQMLKQKRRLKAYFALVKKMVIGLYTHNREPGQKLLILCATVDFIKALTKYLNVAFPDLQVGMHVSGSDYKKLATNDITVSTIKSSGTGVDIPNLREVLMLQATDSKKDNIQVLGRLRRMKDWPDVTPRMTYLACTHIKKHLKYHRSKQEYFGNRVLNHKVMKI